MQDIGIINQQNKFPEILQKLRDNQLPIALYGAGELAQNVYRLLSENYINIDEVFVDDDHWKYEGVFKGHNIKTLNMLCEKYDGINIVIGCNINYPYNDT